MWSSVKSRFEEICICAFIVVPVLAELVPLRDIGYVDEAGRRTHHAQLVFMLLVVIRVGRPTGKGSRGLSAAGVKVDSCILEFEPEPMT